MTPSRVRERLLTEPEEDLKLRAIERLIQDKAEMFEEIRQLRAAVQIFRALAARNMSTQD